MPVFSQDKTAATIDADKIAELDKRVQDAGTEVVNAKNGKGSATLSMGYAGARLGRSILAGLAAISAACIGSLSYIRIQYYYIHHG